MADVELVIRISKDRYDAICDKYGTFPLEMKEWGLAAIKNGTPLPRCKDCKWWKDGDGLFRRGGRDDKCPINRREVYEGNGYCFLFDPQESEGEE